MIVLLITAAVALVLGGLIGYALFRYVIKGKYNEMIAAADKEAEVIKEKKLLEVKEKFLNKKSELEKEVQQRNQRIQQSENKLKQREISLNQRQEELVAAVRRWSRDSSASIMRRNCWPSSRRNWRRCRARSVPSWRNSLV